MVALILKWLLLVRRTKDDRSRRIRQMTMLLDDWGNKNVANTNAVSAQLEQKLYTSGDQPWNSKHTKSAISGSFFLSAEIIMGHLFNLRLSMHRVKKIFLHRVVLLKLAEFWPFGRPVVLRAFDKPKLDKYLICDFIVDGEDECRNWQSQEVDIIITLCSVGFFKLSCNG